MGSVVERNQAAFMRYGSTGLELVQPPTLYTRSMRSLMKSFHTLDVVTTATHGWRTFLATEG